MKRGILIIINLTIWMIGLYSQNTSTSPVMDNAFNIKTFAIDWDSWPYFQEAKQHSDGSIYLYSNDNWSIGVVKLDGEGHKLWDRYYEPEWTIGGFFIDNNGNSYTGYFNSFWDDKVYIRRYDSNGNASDIEVPVEGASYVEPLNITGIKSLNRLYIVIYYAKEIYEPEYQYTDGVIIKCYNTITNEVTTVKDYTPATEFFNVDNIWFNEWGILKGSDDGNIYYARHLTVGDITKLKVEKFNSDFSVRTVVGEQEVGWSECMSVERIETSSGVVAVTRTCPDETFIFDTLNNKIIPLTFEPNTEILNTAMDKEGNLYRVEENYNPETGNYIEFITKYSRYDAGIKWRFSEVFDNWFWTHVLMIDDNNRVYTVGELEEPLNNDWFYITRYIQPEEVLPQKNYAITKSTGDEQIVVVSSMTEPMVSLVTISGTTNPANNIAINFTISTYPAGAEGQMLTKSSETTNQQGLADVQLKLGDIPAEYGVTVICPQCVPESSSVTFTCCGRLRTTTYIQGDPQWGNVVLGSHPPDYLIRQTGCALTSVANLINFYAETDTSIVRTNPLILNQLFISSNVYDAADDIQWGRIPSVIGNIRLVGVMNVGAKYSRTDLVNVINEYLFERLPVILYTRRSTGRDHFMLAVGRCGDRYIVVDPSPPAGENAVRRYDPYDNDLLLMGVRLYEHR